MPNEYKEGFEKYEYETGVKDTPISDSIVVIQEVASARNPFV